MSDIRAQDLVSYDPLSEVTRRERRALLGTSMLGLALVEIPLIPLKLAAFGIEFSEVNRERFAAMYALVVLYFLVAFVVYALSDFVAWRRSEVIRYSAYVQAQRADPAPPPAVARPSLLTETGEPIETAPKPNSCAYQGFASWNAAVFVSRQRAVLEFAVPILFSLFTLFQLWRYNGVA
jgi:hypothetical protein